MSEVIPAQNVQKPEYRIIWYSTCKKKKLVKKSLFRLVLPRASENYLRMKDIEE